MEETTTTVIVTKDHPAVVSFIDKVSKMSREYHVKAGYDKGTHGFFDTFETENLGKFIRVWTVGMDRTPEGDRLNDRRSSFCFIAMKDGETKEMGPWKAGDIFKCATWKKPAKHTRGNVFSENNGMEAIAKGYGAPNVCYLR